MNEQQPQQEVIEAQEDIVESKRNEREQAAAYAVMGLFFGVLIATLSLLFLDKQKQSTISSLDQQIQQEVTTPLASLAKDEQKVETVTKQLASLNSALSSRLKFATILDDLRKRAYGKSAWTALSYKDNEFAISGYTDNFEELNKAVVAVKSAPSVKETKLTNATINEETKKVEFSLTVIVDNALYKVNATKAAALTTSATAGTAASAQTSANALSQQVPF